MLQYLYVPPDLSPGNDPGSKEFSITIARVHWPLYILSVNELLEETGGITDQKSISVVSVLLVKLSCSLRQARETRTQWRHTGKLPCSKDAALLPYNPPCCICRRTNRYHLYMHSLVVVMSNLL